MNESDERPPEPASARDFERRVGAHVERKLAARRAPERGLWFGLGMMGLVGWSIALPTLAGAALGAWLDRHLTGAHSWTLALLVAGLSIGCANAWRWVTRQDRAMHGRPDTGTPGSEP